MAFEAKNFLRNVTHKPGVYLMFNQENKVLYVGKAKNLKKRLSSYFRNSEQLSAKNRALVSHISSIEIAITHTEIEALILENTLIKTHQPPYNILLRDDKSYPYLYLSQHLFPRLTLHRGTKHHKGRYFGPYPNAKAVYESVQLLQKLFQLRLCRDSFFEHRSRPCLQYQIKRCSAPCVGFIDEEPYQETVKDAVLFLEGKNQLIIDKLIQKMQQTSGNLEFEKAALFRDQIAYLKQLQTKQYADIEEQINLDVVICYLNNATACVQILSIRDGRHLGSRGYFPKHTEGAEEKEILSAFLSQYYLQKNQELPDEILLNLSLDEISLLINVLSEHAGRKIQIHHRVRGVRAKWLEMAIENAKVNIEQHKPTQYRERLSDFALKLGLEFLPQRIECFDISHLQGEATVASCVVFDENGARHQDYRRFNIQNVIAGDDCAAMKQALQRRYQHLAEENGILPDILLIDGGKGQLHQAQIILEELQLNQIIIIGIAKGVTRKAGWETLFLAGEEQPFTFPKESPALHLLQQIRDEAHRFAITNHRQQRTKQRKTSHLESIEGIGAKRRQLLLKHFGGLQGVKKAGIEDLKHISGISEQLAKKIYEHFHEQ
jgi:excinuclease ABC subunit C